MQEKQGRAIAVFAHNEGKKILSCLESVKRAMSDGDRVYVLNNGSTDQTGALVAAFAKINPFCKLITIDIGDKANAWNTFVHKLDINADLYCFIDGDCEITPNAISVMENCLIANPMANAAAGLPDERISKKNRDEMLEKGGLAGNLYALPKRFVERIRKNKTHLPVGLIGDDSLVGALAVWDLQPCINIWDVSKIVLCEDANFSYVPLSILSIDDFRLYYRRKIRYSIRHFQMLLLKAPLKEQGLDVLPENVDDLYLKYGAQLKLSWRRLDTVFDYLALQIIKRRIHSTAVTQNFTVIN